MTRGVRSRVVVWAAVALTLTLALATTKDQGRTVRLVADSGRLGMAATTAAPRAMPVEHRRIGTSVQGRGIFAYRVGDPAASLKAVVLGQMHGNEPAGVQLVRSIISGAPIRHVDLWVVPTMNPDGLAAHTRQNAHGVDLNRNWSYQWVHETGTYNSGPHPFSEPESRAMKRFTAGVDPSFIVSLHQPLHGVDSDHPKNPRLMNRLALNLGLPKKPFTCGGGCHGTMTGWFNFHHTGACITVEFGPAPPLAYLTGRAATGVVRAVFGRY